MQQQMSPKQCEQEPDRTDSQIHPPKRQIRDIAASIYRGHVPLPKSDQSAPMAKHRHAGHTGKHAQCRHHVGEQQLSRFRHPAEFSFRIHEISGKDEEQRHVERKAEG